MSIPERVLAHQSGAILFTGNNNKVVMHENTVMREGSIRMGHGCSFVSGANVRLMHIEVVATRDGHVTIGERSGFTWQTKVFLLEPGRITLGAGCLIAGETLLTNSDMHSIIEIETGARINPAEDITLGARVWLGAGASLMKGCVIGAGSIIGYGSLVTGHIPENCMAAGVPAKVIRTGISWRFDLI